MDTDAYFHKTVTFRAGKNNLKFRTSQALFSSFDIDTGTRFLLRSIADAGYRPQQVLDLGCGYGPIGLTLKRLFRESTVHMVDRDALAVDYARQNAELNGINDVEIYGSLGYDDIKRNDFDLVAANIPGKAAPVVMEYLLKEARHYLAPSGLMSIVVVAPLEATVVKILDNTPGVEIMLRRNRSGHAVLHYRFRKEIAAPKPERNGLERGIYRRQDISIQLNDLEYKMETSFGLPEFDSLSYSSKMLVEALNNMHIKKRQYAIAINPGQGHVPVMLWKICRPGHLDLVDRDLLALKYSHLNLVQNGCPAERIDTSHQVGIKLENGKRVDLITGIFREDGKDATFLTMNQAIEQLSPDGMMIISASSTAITRLAAYVESQGQLRIKKRERRRGLSLLLLKKVL
jgi:16S rRNA (guanine1207-N2)-methyltransferase